MGPIAQSVEQRTFNPWVLGSIPSGPTFNANNYLRKIIYSKEFDCRDLAERDSQALLTFPLQLTPY